MEGTTVEILLQMAGGRSFPWIHHWEEDHFTAKDQPLQKHDVGRRQS